MTLNLCPMARSGGRMAGMNSSNSTNTSTNSHRSTLMWFEVIISIISFLGIIGNVLNLVILTRKRMRTTLDRLERSANYGLVALALSDMMFCIIILPHIFLDTRRLSVMATSNGAVALYYRVYGIPVINVFLMVSTWLIVVMAANRYIVVVFPLHARNYLGSMRVSVIIILVYIISAFLTLPYFIPHYITPCQSPSGENMFGIAPRFPGNSTIMTSIRTYNRWVWPVLSTFFPLAVLLFCNTRLILTLRKADLVRRASCRGQVVKETNHKVTLTLVIIVLMYFVLVLPSEILKYINPFHLWGRKRALEVMSAANVLQAMNFAFNFVLYCCVNTHFRHTMKALFTSCCRTSSAMTEKQRMLSMKSSMATETVYSFTETTT